VFATRAQRVPKRIPRGSRALYDLYCVTETITFLRANFFHSQEGANQAVPEALMDMAMKVCGPFHSLSIFLLQQFESFASV